MEKGAEVNDGCLLRSVGDQGRSGAACGLRTADCGLLRGDSEPAQRSVQVVPNQAVRRLLETDEVHTAKWDPISKTLVVTGKATWDSFHELPGFFTLDSEGTGKATKNN